MTPFLTTLNFESIEIVRSVGAPLLDVVQGDIAEFSIEPIEVFPTNPYEKSRHRSFFIKSPDSISNFLSHPITPIVYRAIHRRTVHDKIASFVSNIRVIPTSFGVQCRNVMSENRYFREVYFNNITISGAKLLWPPEPKTSLTFEI